MRELGKYEVAWREKTFSRVPEVLTARVNG